MKNTVELLGYYGSDKIIACSAWTSTSRELTKEKEDRIPELINNLWSNFHETPFNTTESIIETVIVIILCIFTVLITLKFLIFAETNPFCTCSIIVFLLSENEFELLV